MALSKRQAKKIKEYYANQIISNRLKSIHPTGKDKGDIYASKIYESYHITQYSNKAEYELAVENQTRTIVSTMHQDELKKMRRQHKDTKSYIDKLTQERIDEGWRDYQHRDDLIRTGQYEEFRILDYKDKYVEAMKKWGIDEKYIEAMDTADINKLNILFTLPNTTKDEKEKYELKSLGWFYGEIKGPQLAETLENIAGALAHAGIEINDITIETPLPEMHKIYQEKAVDVASVNPARNAYRHLQLEDRPEELNYDELYSAMLDAYDNKRLVIKTNKKGYKYIPFVGSTNPNSKNSHFMRRFMEYARMLGKNIDK